VILVHVDARGPLTCACASVELLVDLAKRLCDTITLPDSQLVLIRSERKVMLADGGFIQISQANRAFKRLNVNAVVWSDN
jgi:hypothetical protein